MPVLVLVTLSLIVAQRLCRRALRRVDDRLMRPADELSPDDIDRWLDLIETFELPRDRKRVP